MGSSDEQESYRARRKATYEDYIDQAKFARQIQADYGKWLLSSLFLIHSAAIFAVLQHDDSEKFTNAGVHWYLVYGLMLALFAGLVTWLNWTLLTIVYNDWADHKLLDPKNFEPLDDHKTKSVLINLCYYGAIASGLASALMVPIAVYKLS